ncbi:MAG: glycine cleavage system protein GcvH [Alphaproteobacteria bacterium]
MGQVIKDLKYTEQHEWAKLEGDTVTVGITDYAQQALGDLVFVELPEVGRKVSQKESIVVVESVKAASEVYAPVSGEIVAVNESLNTTPEQINSAPYESGWIVKIHVSNKSELDSLLAADQYQEIAA